MISVLVRRALSSRSISVPLYWSQDDTSYIRTQEMKKAKCCMAYLPTYKPIRVCVWICFSSYFSSCPVLSFRSLPLFLLSLVSFSCADSLPSFSIFHISLEFPKRMFRIAIYLGVGVSCEHNWFLAVQPTTWGPAVLASLRQGCAEYETRTRNGCLLPHGFGGRGLAQRPHTFPIVKNEVVG